MTYGYHPNDIPEIILNLVEQQGYGSLADWAHDSDYSIVNDRWVDEAGMPVDIVSCFLGAMESAGYI